MTPAQVVQHYGTISRAAKALGVTYQAVQYWVNEGQIPEVRQWAIEAKSKGELLADREPEADASEAS